MSSDQTPPGAEAVRDVRVTSYPGQSTGWAAMSKDVREFDEEKVQSCKDDVDTLLVFAGLFSAVLSAFLVAAYPNLQPSPMAIMNYNLERIAMQTSSYNFTDGKLISTTSLPISPPPFQASPEDIRVNVLWFSSLILSLMTASFGMLVKQWLREFLAVEVPSPQARLRIRHFREPQLHAWKVFEIVACLPLLLQLSLGLFFVGLCYFTTSVHESVGHTTFPLVVGWALFFFGATALPIFLPRCPYRTTLLKTAISHLHHKLSCWAQHIVSQRDVIFLKGTYLSNPDFDFPQEFLRWFDMQYENVYIWEVYQRHCETYQLWLITQFKPFSAIYAAAAQVVMTAVTTCIRTARNALGFILLSIPTRWQDWQSIASPLLSWKSWYLCYVKYFVKGVVALQDIPKEEELVKEVSSDVEILKSVDAIQANDDMLETTFREALQYIHPKPPYKDIVTFILEVLSHRLPTLPTAQRVLPEWPFDGFAPLDSLRTQARAAVSNIIADHASGIEHPILYHRPDFAARSSAEQQKFTSIYGLTLVLSIFASDQDAKLSSDTLSSIRSCFEERVASAIIKDVLLLTTSKGRKNLWENGTALLSALTRIWKLTKPKSTFFYGTLFFETIQLELAKLQQRPDEDFDWNLWSWPENAPREFQNACVQYLCTMVTAASEHHNLQDEDSQERLRNILVCSSRLIRTHDRYNQSKIAEQSFQQLIAFAMKSKWFVNMVITCWMSADNGWNKNFDQEMIDQVVWQPYNLHELLEPRDLELLFSVITEQLSKCSQDLTQSLQLCYHTIYLLLLIQARTAGVEKCRKLFVPIISQIQPLSPGQGTGQSSGGTHNMTSTQEDHKQAGKASELTKACLDLMGYEQGYGSWIYENWKDHFHADSSIFPDDLVETLGKLNVRQRRDKLYRLRELEERRQGDESAEASEAELQSEHNEKAISGRLGTGVGSSDQESPVDDKNMEIDGNREGVVGLAVGDGRSVKLEGVTGTEHTHAALVEVETLHTQSNNGTLLSIGSSHEPLVGIPVHTQDEISDTANEEVKEVEAIASNASATLAHMPPHDNTQSRESSRSGQGPTAKDGAGSALTHEEVARNDGE